MRTSDSTEQIVPAWIAALHEVSVVTEDSSGHHGKYASLGACLAAVKPVLKDLGLAVQQYNVESERGVRVITRIWHESGEWLEDEGLTMPAPSDPQKVGGSVTYARRYALTTFFSITTSDDDAQGATDHMRAQRTQTTSTPAQNRPQQPQEPEESPSPARVVFDALKRYAGTPVAASMKEWLAEQPKSATLTDMSEDEEWCTAVAEKLADTIEAQEK